MTVGAGRFFLFLLLFTTTLLVRSMSAQRVDQHATDSTAPDQRATGVGQDSSDPQATKATPDQQPADASSRQSAGDVAPSQPAAQVPSDSQAADIAIPGQQAVDLTASDQPSAETDNFDEQAGEVEEEEAQLVPEGEQVERRLFVVYGMDLGEVYGIKQNNNNLQQADSAFSFLAPYVALKLRTHRFSIAGRYTAGATYFSQSHQFVINSAVEEAIGRSWFTYNVSLSRRWAVRFDERSDCGDGDYRSWSVLASSENEGTFGLAWINPATLVELNQGAPCVVNGVASLYWRRRREQVQLSFGESYAFLRGVQYYGVGSFRIGVRHYLTRSLALTAYGRISEDVLHTLYPNGSFGPGIGVWQRLTRKTAWSGEAGPTVDTHGRAGFNLSGTLESVLSRQSSASFKVERESSPAYTFGSRWADRASARIQWRGKSELFMLDGNYLHFEGGALSNYTSYFASPQIRWKLARTVELVTGYLYFATNGANTRNGAMLTLHWHAREESLERAIAQAD